MLELTVAFFKYLHFIGFITLVGGMISQITETKKRILWITHMGGIFTVLSGGGWYITKGLLEGWDKINHVTFGIKMSLVLLSIVLSYVGDKQNITRKLYIAHLVILGLIVGIAVLGL